MKFLIIFLALFLFPLSLFSANDAYLIAMGEYYVKAERLSEAKQEFEKALVVNPYSSQAKRYLEIIRKEKIEDSLNFFSRKERGKEIIISQREEIPLQESPVPVLPEHLEAEKSARKETSPLKLKGQYQISFGVEEGEVWGKRANFDLSEENWRILSDKAYNRRENTFDPGIYSQLRFELDYSGQGWGFHSNFDLSPWSFVGKSNKVRVTSAFGDTADVQLKYWANTRYTINEVVYTNLLGNSFILPEAKVVGGRVMSFDVFGAFWPQDTFSIPELKIQREYWPLRELWFDYRQGNFNLRVFPVGMANLAYSSDDPLMLSNRRIFWEESQWLTEWFPGHLNTDAIPQDFFKGFWDDSLARFTRDSSGATLTNLRGFSLSFDHERTSLDFTVASPKNLWQDYESFNTLNSALRGKFFYSDNLTLGLIFASKLGYNERSLDAFNSVFGVDCNLGLGPNTEAFLELATSRSEYDRTSSYETEKRGNAFHVGLINASNEVFGKDYFALNPLKEEVFYKLKLSLTHMDEGFESALSSYRETRDDTFWGRHLSFREPFQFYFAGLYEPSLTWNDVKVFRIGDGIDYGRDVVGFRLEVENLLDSKLNGLFDTRNVHDVNGKYIENVSRLETAYKVNKKLTTKFLGIYHDLPKTQEGIDPFIFDPQTGLYYKDQSADPIDDGKDPTLKTFSLGAEYWLFDWLGLNGIWERTNDYTLAYDNFPRGILNSSQNARMYDENGNRYRGKEPYLYGQHYFPQPPYPWYDIFRTGFKIKPTDKLNIYLDWTRNEFEWAQIIDDNMNHMGLEMEYLPLEKLGFYFRYTYSRCKDISELVNDRRRVEHSHHNIVTETRLKLEKDSELVGQYGVGSFTGIATIIYTPFGGGVATLDTQHIFRLYYRKKF